MEYKRVWVMLRNMVEENGGDEGGETGWYK